MEENREVLAALRGVYGDQCLTIATRHKVVVDEEACRLRPCFPIGRRELRLGRSRRVGPGDS